MFLKTVIICFLFLTTFAHVSSFCQFRRRRTTDRRPIGCLGYRPPTPRARCHGASVRSSSRAAPDRPPPDFVKGPSPTNRWCEPLPPLMNDSPYTVSHASALSLVKKKAVLSAHRLNIFYPPIVVIWWPHSGPLRNTDDALTAGGSVTVMAKAFFFCFFF